MKRLIHLSFVSAFLLASTNAAIVSSFSIDSGAYSIQNLSGVPLTGGSPSIDHDGAVVQLGYFSGPSFIALTGGNAESGGPSGIRTTIGDSFGNMTADGQIFMNSQAMLASTTGFPTTGTQMALRFFDAITVASATHMATVTDALWIWPAPNDPSNPSLDINLDDAGLTAINGTLTLGSTIKTTTAVPEPSTLTFGALAALSAAARRRRRE